MNENPSSDATPEQLLQLLDLQIAQARNQRRIAPRSRGAMLMGGVLLILAGTAAALLFLQHMAIERRSPEAGLPAPEMAAAAK